MSPSPWHRVNSVEDESEAASQHVPFSNSLLSCLTKLNMRPRTFTEHILISTATVGVYIQLYVLFCVCYVIIESDVVMFVREWM